MMSDDASPDPAAASWPPPGLEAARGGLQHVRARARTAAFLLCPPLLWLLFGAPGLRVEPDAGRLLALLLFIGLIAFLGALLALSALVEHARRSRRLGYPSRVLLFVLADDGVGTRDLVLGTGPWRESRDATRDRVLRLQTWAALCATAATLLPPPLLVLGILLALRGFTATAGVLAIAFLPGLLLAVTAGLLRGNAMLLQQWERAGGAWDPGPDTPQDRARMWTHGIGLQAEPRPASMLGLAAIALAGIVTVLLFVAMGTAMTATAALVFTTRALEEVMSQDHLSRNLGTIELARPLRLPVDSSVSATEAGIALHYAAAAGRPLQPGQRPVPAALDSSFAQELRRHAFTDRLWWSVYEDSAWLRDVPLRIDHPALGMILATAAAPHADLLGARYAQPELAPLPDDGEFMRAADFARLVVVRSARAARNGRFAEGERELRALISMGFLSLDNSRTTGDLFVAFTLIGEAHEALAELRAAAGDPSLRASREAYSAAQGRASAGQRIYRSPSVSSSDGDLRTKVMDDDVYPAYRWDALYRLAIIRQCGSMRSMLGESDFASGELAAQARARLPRSAADSAWFDVVVRAEAPPPPERRWRRPEQLLRAVVGDRAAVTSCTRFLWLL